MIAYPEDQPDFPWSYAFDGGELSFVARGTMATFGEDTEKIEAIGQESQDRPETITFANEAAIEWADTMYQLHQIGQEVSQADEKFERYRKLVAQLHPNFKAFSEKEWVVAERALRNNTPNPDFGTYDRTEYFLYKGKEICKYTPTGFYAICSI